jgi:transcriptional regulator with XRE-family HTH domain
MEGDRPLAEFLRARRKVTTVEQVGLLAGGRRRTPGLRREEVAMLAGLSTDYYIRLEQGRERHPSDQVVEALARVFQLDSEGTSHLHDLVHPRPRRGPIDLVDPTVVLLMESWRHAPAYVVNHRLDVLVSNRLAGALYDGLDHNDNLLRLALLNPAAHEFYLDWEEDTRNKVAHLRAAARQFHDDARLTELVDELSGASAQFREWWSRHEVRARTRAPVRFHHHDVGDVITTMQVLSIDSAPGQKLVVFQAEPDSPSECALARLAATGRERCVPSRP